LCPVKSAQIAYINGIGETFLLFGLPKIHSSGFSRNNRNAEQSNSNTNEKHQIMQSVSAVQASTEAEIASLNKAKT